MARLSAMPLDKVRSVDELAPNPLVYERTAFMKHIGRYDREDLRAYYLSLPEAGATVWANYAVNLWEYEHGVEQLTSYPWNITIPMTELCNATCTFCSSPLVPSPEALAVHEVRHFGDALRHAVKVSLQGLGEPLAHPRFEEIIAEIRKYLSPVAQVEIITNGWLLAGHRWELLKSVGITDIQVSVNAATDRTHQVAMGSRPGMFDRVVTNITDVLADPEWPWPECLKVSMVITRHSLSEVPAFLDLFVKKGVQRFQFNSLLPLVTPDWGFGRTEQYLDLWCGHVPGAEKLVERATAAIEKYRRRGIAITAAPAQWLIPVDPAHRLAAQPLSADQQSTAVFQIGGPSTTPPTPCLWMDDRRLNLVAHEQHTILDASDAESVAFHGSPRACRWAYLFRTGRLPLAAGDYTLELDMQVQAGQLYAGILDSQRDDFIVQAPLGSDPTVIPFALTQPRTVEVIIRQGADDSPVRARFRRGRLSTEAIRPQADAEGPVIAGREPRQTTDFTAVVASSTDVAETSAPMSFKRGRIYCPMVYTTLSVFHHSLDVSVCCYMANAPGVRQPNLKEKPVLQVYNDIGLKLVRRTLNSDPHITVCDSCPYGAFRS